MSGFLARFNLPYLLVLVGLSAGVLVLLWVSQRAALRRLSQSLYTDEDLPAFRQKLDSFWARLVLRRATRGILRLEAAIYAGDAPAVWQAAQALAAMRTKPGETLNYTRKTLSFAVTQGNKEYARQCLQTMQQLLGEEQDPQLQEVLADAQLLVGVYLERDTALLETLRQLEQTQQGARKGLTQYRMAKLYHFAGKPQTAQTCLKNALDNLQDGVWRQAALAALEDPGVLELR